MDEVIVCRNFDDDIFKHRINIWIKYDLVLRILLSMSSIFTLEHGF